jgi:predicted transcriptional regulator
MEIQNLLVGALTYLVKFQSTQCPTARDRALMMFDALAEQKNLNSDIQALCYEANELLST